MADDLVTCPYNIAHTIQRGRFDNHLMKCSRNYPNMKLDTCFFNTTHRIKKGLMENHLQTCPDKARHDAQNIDIMVQTVTMTKAVIEDHTGQNEDDEDDWGKSCNRGGYDPKAKIADKNVIRTLQNATPSERKAFRKEEKERLERIRSKNGGEEKSTIPGLHC